MVTKGKGPITEIGQQVPSNLKFGIIVLVATFWAQFMRSLLNELFSLVNITAPVVSDLIVAVAATFIAFLVLESYRRIKAKLKKVIVTISKTG
jgi:hypothetical protein